MSFICNGGVSVFVLVAQLIPKIYAQLLDACFQIVAFGLEVNLDFKVGLKADGVGLAHLERHFQPEFLGVDADEEAIARLELPKDKVFHILKDAPFLVCLIENNDIVLRVLQDWLVFLDSSDAEAFETFEHFILYLKFFSDA